MRPNHQSAGWLRTACAAGVFAFSTGALAQPYVPPPKATFAPPPPGPTPAGLPTPTRTPTGVVIVPKVSVFEVEAPSHSCMDPAAVKLRYLVVAGGGISSVRITRELSDKAVSDPAHVFDASAPYPTAKEAHVVDADAATYASTLTGYKLDLLPVGGTAVSKKVLFHFRPAMDFRIEGDVSQTLVAPKKGAGGGSTVQYEALATSFQGVAGVKVRGEPVAASHDPHAITNSEATIVPGTPVRLRWSILWPAGTETLRSAPRRHLFTARQRGDCGQTMTSGPIAGVWR